MTMHYLSITETRRRTVKIEMPDTDAPFDQINEARDKVRQAYLDGSESLVDEKVVTKFSWEFCTSEKQP